MSLSLVPLFRRYSCLLLLAGIVLQTTVCSAQPWRRSRRRAVAPVVTPGLWHKNLVGVQLGPWFSRDLGKSIADPNYRLVSNSTAFHLELFYQPQLIGTLQMDFSLGAVSRGDIRITDERLGSQASTFGTATIYPVGVGLQWLPLAKSVRQRLQPAFRAGGSLIIGTERLESFIQSGFGQFIGTSSETRFALGYYAGAGLLFVVGPQFALTGGVKYQYARFSQEVFGVRDYSGVQVLFGGSFLYR